MKYTWDDLYERAIDTGYGDTRLKAKDEARWTLTQIILDKKGYDIDECECPEDEIERFLWESDVEYWFDERGNLIEVLKIDDSAVIIEKILNSLEDDKDIRLVTHTGDCENSYIVAIKGVEYRIVVRKENMY